jgi:predicted permease
MLALTRLLIALAAAIVPGSLRDEWTREWQAELWHRQARLAAGDGLRLGAKLDLLARASGAVVHAGWLRKEEWSLAVILQDVRYALRGLRSRPAFTLTAVLMLALGIGATATVFSVIYGVLLAPLPYRDPGRLVQIWEINPLKNWTAATVAPANLLDWRDRNHSFESIAYYIGSDGKGPGALDVTLTGAGEPERLHGMSVSANFFDVLGSMPAFGRTFKADEARPGQTRVVVLSDGFWRRRFAGDPSIVGRRIDLNGNPVTVAGIMPRTFYFPGAVVDFWAPLVVNEAELRSVRRPHWLRTVARLAPGVTLEQARGDLTAIARDLERQYPDTNTQMGVGLGPLHEWFVADVREALLILMGAVSLVLVIACTNVASLLLAWASMRRREIAIRVALGAGRLRLVRQLLTESLVLGTVGAAAGALATRVAVDWVRTHGPTGVPRLDQIGVDGSVVAFIAAIAFATAIVFGLVPALQSVRDVAPGSLQEGNRGSTGGGTRMRRVLIVAEVALSVILLVGAGLLLRSFVHLRSVNPGVDVSGALSFRISLPQQRYGTDEKAAAFYSEAAERVRAIPGVLASGATVRLALQGYNWTGDLFIDGRPDVWGTELRHKAITPGYLQAAGIPILRGRDFGPQDTASGQPVVIVNQTLARRYFPDRDPIGQRLTYGRPQPGTTPTWHTIVAVVADEKQDGLAAEVKPEVYDPHAQDASNSMSMIVRTAGDPLSFLAAVRQQIAAVDRNLALYDVRTLEQVVDASLATERFALAMLTVFAGGALLLAAIGLYGVVAFAVTTRTREIGVRLALGATRPSVLKMVVWDGLRVVLLGLTIGLAGAVALVRVIESFLFQTQPVDPLVFVAVPSILALTGALASYLPALRAARVDPAVSLRQ